MINNGMLLRKKWSLQARCTDICVCTGARKSLNGLRTMKSI
ncbi:MAG: hypothetical protein SVK54_02015 [candidate division WOR-3 bacterium]|nr:hypothetical protein [candidate division WOR-3 bacterium]